MISSVVKSSTQIISTDLGKYLIKHKYYQSYVSIKHCHVSYMYNKIILKCRFVKHPVSLQVCQLANDVTILSCKNLFSTICWSLGWFKMFTKIVILNKFSKKITSSCIHRHFRVLNKFKRHFPTQIWMLVQKLDKTTIFLHPKIIFLRMQLNF